MDTSTKVASALMAFGTIIFAYTLYMQLKNSREEKIRNGINTSVESYADMQKFFIEHNELDKIYKSIYGNVNVDEYATLGLLAQQIENTMEATDCDATADQCRIDAWDYVFQQWVSSDIFRKYWPKLRYEFTVRTQDYIDELIQEYDNGNILYPVRPEVVEKKAEYLQE